MVLQKREFLFLILFVTTVILILLVFFVLVIVINVRLRVKKQVELLEAILSTEEKERNRIAHDMHDELGPSLAAIKLQIRGTLKAGTDESVKEKIEEISGQLDRALQNLRYLALNLSSTFVEQYGLIEAIQNMRTIFERNSEVRFNCSVDTVTIKFSLLAQTNIYRIIQELVHNSMKHSNCSIIDLTLHSDMKQMVLTYNDNGNQVKSEKPQIKGLGSGSINHRVKFLKGTLTANRDFSHGAHYILHFPLNDILNHENPPRTKVS